MDETYVSHTNLVPLYPEVGMKAFAAFMNGLEALGSKKPSTSIDKQILAEALVAPLSQLSMRKFALARNVFLTHLWKHYRD